jgi:acetyl esterase/lipase
MPYGYLVTILLIAWCTYFAIAPRNWPRSVPFLNANLALVNELPFIILLWLAASTWIAYSQGSLNSLGGEICFIFAVITAAGLAAIVVRALPTSTAVNDALDKGLGLGWRSAISPDLTQRLRSRFRIAGVLGPLGVRRWTVRRIANVRYGDAGRKNMLDVYLHRSRSQNAPILIHLHGGRLRGGRKNSQALPLLYHFARQGWICISANYRLSPAATFPDHLIDAKKVIAWARGHSSMYDADPNCIFIAGGSSGAQLASLAALTSNDPKFQPGFEDEDTSVTAAISLYGDYDWTNSVGAWPGDRSGYLMPIMKRSRAKDPDAWAEASPLAHVRKDAPPFFVIHGDRDSVLPVKDARHFAETLDAVSQNPVVYAELPNADHNFDFFHSIRVEGVLTGIEAFATWVRARESLK